MKAVRSIPKEGPQERFPNKRIGPLPLSRKAIEEVRETQDDTQTPTDPQDPTPPVDPDVEDYFN